MGVSGCSVRNIATSCSKKGETEADYKGDLQQGCMEIIDMHFKFHGDHLYPE